MIVVATIGTVLIAAAAVMALVRVERGPSMLDRTVAFDLLTTTIVGAVAVEAAVSRRTESIPVILVLALVGFIGSVAVARFAAREPTDGPPGDPSRDGRAEGPSPPPGGSEP